VKNVQTGAEISQPLLRTGLKVSDWCLTCSFHVFQRDFVNL